MTMVMFSVQKQIGKTLGKNLGEKDFQISESIRNSAEEKIMKIT